MDMPKLRFRDSKGNNFLEWLYKSIKDIGTVYTGNTPTTSCLEYYGNEYPWITPSDIQSDSVIFSSKKMLSERGYQKCRQLPAGAVLITCIASIGKNVILGKAGSCNQQINAIVPKEDMSSYFILYALTMKTKDLLSLGGNGGMKIVKKSIFEKMLIPVPSLPEQQKIADFLSSYDEKISIQRERVESLERRKKGLLQKVFSQEIRFKAEDGNEFPEWGKKKIEEICSHFKSGKYISASDILPMGIYPVYGGNGIRGYANHFNHNGDYIVIGRQGALCGNVRRISGLNYCTEHAIAVQANSDNCTFFLEYLFIVMRLGQYSDQGAQPGLAVNKLVKLETEVPCLKEQEKIATFFTAIDDQINIERERLSTMETIKKGLLQGLFC